VFPFLGVPQKKTQDPGQVHFPDLAVCMCQSSDGSAALSPVAAHSLEKHAVGWWIATAIMMISNYNEQPIQPNLRFC